MSQETEVTTEAAPRPWVKPAVERIPLNTAQGGAPDKNDDGIVGSS